MSIANRVHITKRTGASGGAQLASRLVAIVVALAASGLVMLFHEQSCFFIIPGLIDLGDLPVLSDAQFSLFFCADGKTDQKSPDKIVLLICFFHKTVATIVKKYFMIAEIRLKIFY